MNERARVPFALVGVLLLVTSATLTATVGTHSPQRTPEVDRVMDAATAETLTTLRGAADEAATEAASAPVTLPANSTAGRALNDSQPFRDALRLRLYLTAANRLAGVEVERNGTIASATLPAVEPTARGYREAIERVRVERAGDDDAALRVEIEGVTLEATRNGRTIANDEPTPSFVVTNPALLLHDRTERFQRRANASVADPGLGRRLTARLYPIAWARGLAQYGGAPISNVLANRHVELAANDALLAEQLTALGAVDPDGDRGVAAAGRRVATTDLLAGLDVDGNWTDVVLGVDGSKNDTGRSGPGTWQEEPNDSGVTVDVGADADRAFAALVGIDVDRPTGNVEGGRSREIARVVERVHTVESRFDVRRKGRTVSGRGDTDPGPGWRLVDERTTERVGLDEADGRLPTASGWSTRDGAVFDATVTERTTRRWTRDNESKTTASTVEREFRLSLAVQARTMPLEGVHDGTLDGALSEATDRAIERAIRNGGGLRSAARTAAIGETLPDASATAESTVERERLESDLRDLRERTRNRSVTVSAPAAGAGRANPPARLREELDDDRTALRGEGGTSARERSFLAVRGAYLDELDARLEGRASVQSETNSGIEDAVGEYLDVDQLDRALASHRAESRPEPERVTDPAGNLTLSVDTAPAYLPTSEVSRERMAVRGGGSVHPLAARNVNVFTSPHGQVAESIVDRIPFLGTDRVSLKTAATALAATDGGPRTARTELEDEVGAASTYVRGELRTAMIESGVPAPTAAATLESDATTAGAALELANGTTVDRAVRSIDREPAERDRIRVRLETTLEDALRDERARPPRETTNGAVESVRTSARDDLEGAIADGLEEGSERARKRALGERMGSLPAGLPVAPVPGYWFATANVWYVDVGGTYERFAIRADRGDPTGATTYLRDGRTARLTHDGEQIRLGSAERVSFRTETAVVVVVPPGGSGVGDTGGEMDERSAGWPPD